jgi:metal-dependent hydrolase (beta-lactamase superfamily II)
MTSIFITGDRTDSIAYIGMVAVEMLKAQAAGATIITGDSESGVEALVKAYGEQAGVEVAVIGGYGKSWDARHEYVRDEYADSEVVAIHVEPHASSVIKSLVRVFDDGVASSDRLRLVTPHTAL